jgi:hypothetical protein
MRQRVMTKRRREVLELRDACLLLAARRGAQRELGGVPVLELCVGPFTIRLVPAGGRRGLQVWRGDAAGAPVLELRWSGDELEVVGLRRGAWEAELLALAR